METYGRHRDSITDIEDQLHDIFYEHPSCTDKDGEPRLPGTYLVEVVQAFSDRAGIQLMSDDELELLKNLLATNTGLEVTPAMLVQFVAEKTKTSPPVTPVDSDERGRTDDFDGGYHSRSSSRDSDGTRRGPPSRPPSRGTPQTPTSSVFDSSKRQRATPLNAAPSSWTKRPPPHRRKSDAGSRSDSEYSGSPTAFNIKSRSRTRAPSNPTSPSSSMMLELSSPDIGSPPYPGSRPHSRQQSLPTSKLDYSSPDEEDATLIHNSISSLPMPHSSDSDEEDDAENDRHLVMGRSLTSSTVSMDPDSRLDSLQRANDELARKLVEAERSLQRRLAEHDSEIEEMQSRLDEMRSELSATKREEKELRSKERQNQTQITALELEISKMTKALEHARANYSSLQKQYQEQCTASEKYRDDLRSRDETIRTLREGASLFELEQNKWAREQIVYEERLANLEEELVKAADTQRELDEQKQENLMLKETIDRMRYDMDELRSGMSAAGSNGTQSGQNSAASTMKKSLKLEMLGRMQGTNWDLEEEETLEGEDAAAGEDEEEETEQVTSGGDDTEGEDVIQTIITRKKRKVPSRATVASPRSRPVSFATRTFEELKEYSDASTQYDPRQFFVSSFTQTPPEPKIPTRVANTQTEFVVVKTEEELEREKPVPKVTIEMEIQTDEVEDETGADTMASSSSTLLPPTPKAKMALLDPTPTPTDQPPAYTTEEEEWRRVGEVLRKYHPGLDLHALQTLLTASPTVSSIEELLAMPGSIRDEAGIPEELLHEWKALKEELGVECLVIDKILASAAARSASASSSKEAGPATKRRSGRFYNIYNTYVYGDKNGSNVVSQAAMFLGVSAFFLLALTPYLAPPAAYSVPGGPSYYDRQAWSAFNSLGSGGEGFWGDAGFGRVDTDPTGAVWSFLGRIGRGAVRTVQGWPT